MRTFLIVVLLTLPPVASACVVPPPEQHVSNVELIARTKNIVLAKVTSIKKDKNNWDTTYTFQTIEVLRGNLPETFQIRGFPELKKEEDIHFENHTDVRFWRSAPGRNWGSSSNDTDCIIHPQFVSNRTYLIFYDTPYHSKSFELIVDPLNDKWLKYVREQLSRP